MNITNQSTPQKRNRNNSFISVNDLFTPAKSNSDFFDTSHLGEFEVVRMLHDADDMLDLDIVNLPQSMLDLNVSNTILNAHDFEKKPTMESKTDLKKPLAKKLKNKSKQRNSSKRKSFISKTPKINFQSNNFKINMISQSSKNEDIFFSDEEEEVENEPNSIVDDVYNAQRKYCISTATIKKLQELDISLIHEVPPQHKIETTAGTHPMTREQKKIFETFEPLVKGKFTKSEDEIIRNNWEYFCKIHKWDVKNVDIFLFMRHQGKFYAPSLEERQKFVKFLANGLPGRSLYSVYQRFKYLYAKHHVTNGRFTEEEDRKIILYMKNSTDSKKNYADLANILGRTVSSVFKRCRILKQKFTSSSKQKEKQQFLTKVIWTMPLIEEFLQNLLELTLSQDIIELKNAFIPKVVWQEIQEKMCISENLLKNFWFQKLHLQLFSPTPILLNDIKVKLIEYLHASELSDSTEINWRQLSNHFDGTTTAFICEIVFRLLRHVKRKNNLMTFVESVNYLYDVMIPCLKEQAEGKFLPRFSYQNKVLEIIEEDLAIRDLKEECDEDLISRRSNISLSPFNENVKVSNIKWTLKKRENFIKTLLDVTISADIIELKDAIIPRVIWEEMEKRLNIDVKELCRLWYTELHMQLFCPKPIYINDLKIQLIQLVYREKVTDFEKIIWPKVCHYLDGMTTVFISQVFFNLIDSASKEINSDNFCDILEYLYRTMIPKLKSQPVDKILPRIIYENKTMKVVIEEFQEDMLFKEERRSSTSSIEVEDEKNKEILWTLSNRKNFIKTLLDVTICKHIDELKDAIIPRVIWEEMEKRLNIDLKELCRLWYKELHMQLFCPKPIYINDLKIQLIQLLYREKVTDFDKIDWQKICYYFDGMTTAFISQIFFNLVDSACKEINSKNFCDILEYLYRTMIPKLLNQPNDQFLPRITFENKTMRVVLEEFQQDEFKQERESSTSSLEIEVDDKEICWTLEKRKNFIEKLLDVTCSTNILELKNALIPEVVWDELELIMNIDKKILRELWYFELHMQLFCQKPILMNDIKIRLVEHLYEEKIVDRRQIIWTNVCKYFDGFTSYFLVKIFYYLVRSVSEEIHFDNLRDIIIYLHEKKLPSLINKDTDKTLPRLSYERGFLKILD